MKEILITAITAIASILASGGGAFAYLKAKHKIKLNEHANAVSEWKELYDEMRGRLDKQEEENESLRNELIILKEEIGKLTIELQNYKKYDIYINNLEAYADQLLAVLKTLASHEAYQNLVAKKPVSSTAKSKEMIKHGSQ